MSFFSGLDLEGYDRQYTDRQLVRRMADYFAPYRRQLVLAVLLILVIAGAGSGLPLSRRGPAEDRVLAADGLSELFGLEMAASEAVPVPEPARTPAKPPRARRAAKAAAVPEDTGPAAKRGRPRTSSPTKPKTPNARPTTRAKKRRAAKR